jgi:hypothetical protein
LIKDKQSSERWEERVMKIENNNPPANRKLAASEALQNDFGAAASQAPRLSESLDAAFGLGLFMISACAFGTLLGHTDSPVHQEKTDEFY